jgi:lipocalin
MKLFLSIFILLLFTSCQGQTNMIDKTVVANFNLQSYLGQWYEIARYDHSFERGLVGVTATYSIRPDGKIKVVNAGYKNSLTGKRSEAIGKAKVPNPAEPAKLKVAFFWFFYADYFVLELDPNYQWAAVGSSSNDYLWILSRTPQMDKAFYNDILQRLTKRGYDTQKLILVTQAGG